MTRNDNSTTYFQLISRLVYNVKMINNHNHNRSYIKNGDVHMNNNIYITLASPSVSAPDTGAFSSVHNGTTGTNGSNSILILSGLAILILIVAMAILLLVKKCNKDRKSNGRNHKGPFIRLLSRKATLFTCLMLLFSLAFATAFVVHKSADKTANATPADPSESNALTITVDDVRETIETNSSGVVYAVMPSM